MRKFSPKQNLTKNSSQSSWRTASRNSESPKARNFSTKSESFRDAKNFKNQNVSERSEFTSSRSSRTNDSPRNNFDRKSEFGAYGAKPQSRSRFDSQKSSRNSSNQSSHFEKFSRSDQPRSRYNQGSSEGSEFFSSRPSKTTNSSRNNFDRKSEFGGYGAKPQGRSQFDSSTSNRDSNLGRSKSRFKANLRAETKYDYQSYLNSDRPEKSDRSSQFARAPRSDWSTKSKHYGDQSYAQSSELGSQRPTNHSKSRSDVGKTEFNFRKKSDFGRFEPRLGSSSNSKNSNRNSRSNELSHSEKTPRTDRPLRSGLRSNLQPRKNRLTQDGSFVAERKTSSENSHSSQVNLDKEPNVENSNNDSDSEADDESDLAAIINFSENNDLAGEAEPLSETESHSSTGIILRKSLDLKKQRVAKVIADSGRCSRRQAEELIAEGRVQVNGKFIDSPATLITDHSIKIDGKLLGSKQEKRLFLFNKPAGFICTNQDPEERPTVFDLLPRNLPRLVAVGRLDFNTEGLLLFSTSGEMARYIELPKNKWIRKYRVRVFGKLNHERLAALAKGIRIGNVRYGAIDVKIEMEKESNSWLLVSLSEGKNREIRKIMEEIGLQVNRLIRIAFGPFALQKIASGQIIEVNKKILKNSLPEFIKS